MLDYVIGSIADFMGKVSEWLTLPSIPWSKFDEYWDWFTTKIAPWNIIFPISDLMTIIGLILAFSVALMIFYTVVLIKSFIPFSGGK